MKDQPIQEPVTFTAACAIERDYIYVAGKPDSMDNEDAFSRLFFFDEQNLSRPWARHDLPDWDVVSLCTHGNAFGAPRVYCALSRNGEIEYRWPGGEHVERIDGAGVARTALPIFGYVNAIREIAGQLYVCGSGGQVYLRVGADWLHIAPALKTPVQAPSSGLAFSAMNAEPHNFAAIDGFAADDIYVVGDEGEIQHFDGVEWSRSATPTDEILTAVHCAEDGTVWACGFNGTLLRGNHDDGFEDLSTVDDNMIFSSVARFADATYVASSEGLFRFDGNAIRPITDAGDAAVPDLMSLDVRDGVLWWFGYNSIARFDGARWTHFSHPDNV